MSNRSKSDICYLCGRPLNGEASVDVDHVPAKVFFAKTLRRTTNLSNLWTLRTHKSCNHAFSFDEEYFVQSMGPLAGDSDSGKALLSDMATKTEKSNGPSPLAVMVSKEFDPTPGGVFLPAGRIAKRSDGKRIRRVIWKIARGLFFKEHGLFLPELTPNESKVLSVGEKLPERAASILDMPQKGIYPGVFAYKTAPRIDFERKKQHTWAMLFWDRLIALVSFHDPTCACLQCAKK